MHLSGHREPLIRPERGPRHSLWGSRKERTVRLACGRKSERGASRRLNSDSAVRSLNRLISTGAYALRHKLTREHWGRKWGPFRSHGRYRDAEQKSDVSVGSAERGGPRVCRAERSVPPAVEREDRPARLVPTSRWGTNLECCPLAVGSAGICHTWDQSPRTTKVLLSIGSQGQMIPSCLKTGWGSRKNATDGRRKRGCGKGGNPCEREAFAKSWRDRNPASPCFGRNERAIFADSPASVHFGCILAPAPNASFQSLGTFRVRSHFPVRNFLTPFRHLLDRHPWLIPT